MFSLNPTWCIYINTKPVRGVNIFPLLCIIKPNHTEVWSAYHLFNDKRAPQTDPYKWAINRFKLKQIKALPSWVTNAHHYIVQVVKKHGGGLHLYTCIYLTYFTYIHTSEWICKYLFYVITFIKTFLQLFFLKVTQKPCMWFLNILAEPRSQLQKCPNNNALMYL